MPASAGRDWALSILVNGTYQPVGGLRTRSLSIDGTNIEVTTADSAGRWRELLPSAGVMSLEIEGSGVYQRDTGVKQVIANMLSQTLVTLRFANTELGVQIDGLFLIDTFKITGPYNEANTYDAKFMSSGQPTIAVS
jgi:TP901-1 family phage major tail protein